MSCYVVVIVAISRSVKLVLDTASTRSPSVGSSMRSHEDTRMYFQTSYIVALSHPFEDARVNELVAHFVETISFMWRTRTALDYCSLLGLLLLTSTVIDAASKYPMWGLIKASKIFDA